MAELPNVRLDLANRPENVVLVREMLSGVAEAIDLDGATLNDVQTAVTEACNNAVLHAYRGGEGPLEVEVFLTADALYVVVRDHGIGIRAQTGASAETSSGIGLPVIRALVHRVQFRDADSGGAEVHMEFALQSAPALTPLDDRLAQLPPPPDGRLATTATLAIAPARLARTILPRVLCVLAARAHFSTDRISDAQMVADALVAHAGGSHAGDSHAGDSRPGDYLLIAVEVRPRSLELHVGPLGPEDPMSTVVGSSLADLGPVIDKLTDHHRIAALGARDVLTLGLVDRR
jgi:serine/threonine-protein kinase RsbW